MNPTDRLTVTLEAQQWNQVLSLVAEGPFRVAAPLMQTIQLQLQNEAPPGNGIMAGQQTGVNHGH